MRKMIAIFAGLSVLGLVNYSIYNREQLLTEGHVVLLELAPVDPRSLMQGDYMALRFKVADDAFGRDSAKKPQDDGQIVLTLNSQGVSSFAHFDDGAPLANNQIRMRYRVRNHQTKFASNAFFFQEGSGDQYSKAGYGEFRVAKNGDAILTRLRDRQLVPLGVASQK